MMANPRITVQVSENGGASGFVEIFLNKEGVEQFIDELRALSETNDHFHFFAPEWGAPDGLLRLTPYEKDASTAGHVKVNFRSDDWDRDHAPHTLDDN
ncbi:MAG: hypothetical protein AAF224_10180 [Pseudomonadota bacterium]